MFHRRSGSSRARTASGTTETRRNTTTLASATIVSKKQIRSSTRKQSWMEEAWAFYDTIPELHAAVRWMGNSLSRARLFVGEVDPDHDNATGSSGGEGGGDPVPSDNPPDAAAQILDELHAGTVGQGEMMRRLATNLDIVGEAFLIRLPKKQDPSAGPQDEDYRWIVASTDEFSYTGQRPTVKLPEDGQSVQVGDNATVIRLWNPHPRQAWEADSPVRANLPVLREVMSLSQHITATVESRLAGAGILAIPKSATLPNPNVSEGANPLHHNAFVDAMTTAMVTPITDRDNASAVVPIVLSVDDEAIGKLQHISFASELDGKVTEMRQDALSRFAAGTDLPKEIITGIGESSHWNASEIEDQAIKVALEPLIGVICDALTQQLLWPAMRAMGEADPEKWCIWFSTSELSQRPDRSQDAQALFDKGVLSPESLLRENGFSPDDAPDEEDKKEQFAKQVILAKPDLLAPLAQYVGMQDAQKSLQEAQQQEQAAKQPPPGQQDPNAQKQVPPGQQGQQKQIPGGNQQQGQGQNRPAQQQPSKGTAPNGGQNRPQSGQNSRPNQQASAGFERTAQDYLDAGWQLAAIELVALRALELAGKRMLTNSPRGLRGRSDAQSLNTWDLHTIAPTPNNLDKLLDNAFDLAGPVIGDQPCIRSAVDQYCRALITSGSPHRREYLVQALSQAGCLNDSTVAA